MYRTTLSLLALIMPSLVNSACPQDSVEIGDIGPDSQQVCDMLKTHFPSSDVVILDRHILSSHAVSVNDHFKSLRYSLVGPNWKLLSIDVVARDGRGIKRLGVVR